MADILVTGGLGFIGHNVAKKLEALGHNIVVMDTSTNIGNMSHSELKYLTAERRRNIKTQNVFFTSINDDWAVDGLLGDFSPSIVIHLASFPRQETVQSDPQFAARTMCEGLINMLQSSKKHGVERFVYISSSMVYGDFYSPAHEDQQDLNPKNLYGILKLSGEMITRSYASDRMSYTIIRPTAVYGPRDRSDRLITRFLLNARSNNVLEVKGQDQRLDFTFVDDAAEGIVLAALSPRAANQIYNISRGVARSILDAAALAVSISGKGSIQVVDKDSKMPTRAALDCSKAEEDLGFEPKIDLEEGIAENFKWMNTSPYWRKND